MTDITIPNVGESVAEVTIATWFKKPGEAVAKDEPLVELETDKAAQELVSPEDGVLQEILVGEGENAAIGTKIAVLGAGSGAASGDGATPKKEKAPAEKTAPAEETAPKGDSTVKAEGTATPPVSAEAQDIKVPNVGESVSEVTVAAWMVKVGDSVEKDQALVELETDKAAQELVSPGAGTITDILIGEGETAAIGDVLARLGGGPVSAATSDEAKKGDESGHGGELPDVPPTNIDSIPGGSIPDDVKVMPAAAKLIRERGLDAARIKGTGKGGRIRKGDVLEAIERGDAAHVAAEGGAYGNAGAPSAEVPSAEVPSYTPAPTAKAPAPSAPRELGPREERVRMSRLRQTIARRLKDAQNTAAMLTTYNEADMSEIMALRSKYKETFVRRHDVKLGFMSFFVKACVQALKEVPAVNAEIDGTDIIYKNFYDISIAVGTPKGLVVPVIRDCDGKTLAEIEKSINAVAEKARDGELSIADMQGGTFTISNGGVYGSLMSSPILNPPQSGILGMHKIEKRPVVVTNKAGGDEIVIRPMMYLALSYDHRIVDGKEAVTFLVRVKECLEDPERLLLEL